MNPQDVKIVANALLENHWSIDESGKNCYVYCKYCESSLRYIGYDYDFTKIIHKLDCPVLVARDLLT